MEKQRSYLELIERYWRVALDIGANLNPIGELATPLGDYTLYSLHVKCGDGRQRICLSTGMHGDEPAGPESLLRGLLEVGRRADRLNAEFLIFPCDNPSGYELNTRENWQGLDLNREFSKDGQAAEIAIVESACRGRHFDFTIDIHEDIDTEGMYLYERTRKGYHPIGDEMIQALRDNGHAIHEADWIEGRPASDGIIWPAGRLRKFELPKAVYLWHNGSPHLITTESPGKRDMDTRVSMQLVCFEVFLKHLEAGDFARVLPSGRSLEPDQTGPGSSL